MKELIKKICKQIEKNENIKILFCVESGSRVWRMNSLNFNKENEVKKMDELLEICLGVIIFFIVIIGLIMIPVYYSSCREAKVINEEFGTDYICGDLFWSGDVILQNIEGRYVRLDIEKQLT